MFFPLFFSKRQSNPESKVNGANMGPTWLLSAPDGPHVGSIREPAAIQRECVLLGMARMYIDRDKQDKWITS